MEFIDTHTHLYLEQFDQDRPQAVEAALQAGVKRMIMPNVDAQTIDAMMQAAAAFPAACLPMMALHPTSVKSDWKQQMKLVEQWLEKEKFYAIGETGIDLYWDKTFLDEQIACLARHIELALTYKLPLVIHSRNSLEPIFRVLHIFRGSGLTGVFHCFPGNLQQAQEAVSMGFMLGIGGVVTYKNSMMSKVVKHIGLEHLVLETDAPYLPPVPFRGQRNESSYLPHIARKVAELKGVDLPTVARETTANAKRLFGL